MCFGEFFRIVAADPARMGLRQGEHRQLHELCAVHRAVEQGESRGIDHVFRIVQHQHAHAYALAVLVLLDRPV